MKKLLYIIIGVVVLVGVIFFFVNRGQNQEEVANLGTEETGNPWIEVISPKISRLGQELKTGDEIGAGDTLITDATGLANLYFPDGSVLRIDSNTTVTIKETVFGEANDSLVAKFVLSAGRVWSKVVSLATPDSSWSVETSNAVVTVRGTAFGVEEGVQTEIIGSESTVTIDPKDPDTGQILSDRRLTLSGEKFLALNKEDIRGAIAGRKNLSIGDLPDSVRNRAWVKKAREADINFETIRRELMEQGLEGRALRRALRQRVLEQIIENQGSLSPTQSETKPIETAPTTPLQTNTTNTNTEIRTSATSPKPVSLEVVTKSPLGEVLEGATVQFQAILNLSDGSSRLVTDKVSWQVIGSIGTITTTGLFTAKLDISVAELGIVPGSVAATLENESSATLTGASPIFNVRANVGNTLYREGEVPG